MEIVGSCKQGGERSALAMERWLARAACRQGGGGGCSRNGEGGLSRGMMPHWQMTLLSPHQESGQVE